MPLNVLFEMVALPLIPPALLAVFPLRVLLVIVSTPPLMPPPYEKAELPLKVLSVIVNVPLLSMAPPEVKIGWLANVPKAELLLTVLLVIVIIVCVP